MRAPQIGALVGASGGLAFVVANAVGPLAWLFRIAGILVFGAVVLLTLRTGRRVQDARSPSRAGWRTYLVSVTTMVVAFPLGSLLLTRVLGERSLVLPWVVLVVGAHFLPFARAFHTRDFTALGWTLVVIAVAGGLAVLLLDPAAAPWTGVLAGFALLGYCAAGSVRWLNAADGRTG